MTLLEKKIKLKPSKGNKPSKSRLISAVPMLKDIQYKADEIGKELKANIKLSDTAKKLIQSKLKLLEVKNGK